MCPCSLHQAMSTRRGTHATSSEKPKETSPDAGSSCQPEHPCSFKSPGSIICSPRNQSDQPSSDDNDLPVCNLVNMTSRHPSAGSTPPLHDIINDPSPSTAVIADTVPRVKREDFSIQQGSLGEEVLGRRRHVGTGARRATGTSYEDPICLSDSDSDGDSGDLGSNTSAPSSGSSPTTGGSLSSATGLEQLSVPASAPSNDTWVSVQRQLFGEQQVFVIDASRVGNVARFFNVSSHIGYLVPCVLCGCSNKLKYLSYTYAFLMLKLCKLGNTCYN